MEQKDSYLTDIIIKLLVIIFGAILVLIILFNIGEENKKNQKNFFSFDDRFKTVEEDGTHKIIVDTETNVLYLEYETTGNKYGITVLLNSDGAPMLFDENKGEE